MVRNGANLLCHFSGVRLSIIALAALYSVALAAISGMCQVAILFWLAFAYYAGWMT